MRINIDDEFKPGIGWKYSLYFHHPDSDVDVGFLSLVNGTLYSRAIRDVASKNMDVDASNTNPHLGDEKSRIWIPLANYRNISNDNYVYCGWIDANGQKWGAIWRYENSYNYYTPTSGEGRDFIVKDGDFRNWSLNLYRFTITAGSASFDPQTSSVTSNYSSTENTTTFTISGITENPTFIKFN